MGGVGYFAGSSSATLNNLRFENNSAIDGGALLFSTGSSFDIRGCDFI